MGYEQRRHLRLDDYIHVSLEPTDSGGDPGFPLSEVDCTIADISEGGVRMQTNRALPKGLELKLHIMIDQATGGTVFVSALGEVKWVQEAASGEAAEAGIEFTFLSGADAALLKEHLTRRRP